VEFDISQLQTDAASEIQRRDSAMLEYYPNTYCILIGHAVA